MSGSLKLQRLSLLQLPIVFTPEAWQRAVLLEHSNHSEKLLFDRLSNVLCAAFETRRAYPHKPYVVFEVAQIGSTDHPHHVPLLRLSLSLLHEPDQPEALLIALAGEHQR